MKTLLDDPVWLGALSLIERAAILRSAGGEPDSKRTARAVQRGQHWRSEAGLVDSALFAERLAGDGLTPELFLRVLAEPVSTLNELAPVPPPWLADLAAAFEGEAALPSSLAGDLGFLEALRPVIAAGYAELVQGLGTDDGVAASLLRHLLERLRWMVERTLILELHVSRLEGKLAGETPETRFNSFIGSLRDRQQALATLSLYPVLARETARHTRQWAAATSLETLRRFTEDRDDLVRHVFGGEDPGALTALEPGHGDRHDGGRTVTLLTFASGRRLVYKPRSLAVDSWFQELLLWLNERGVQPELLPLRCLDRSTHGWMEFISPASCSTLQELERFYERQGAWVALLYALEANDFHWENVIAAGEHPVLVDLETLFQPAFPGLGPVEDPTTLTVLRGGLLPRRFRMGHATALDLSGIGATAGQKTKGRFPVDIGTDRMRFELTLLERPSRDNQPMLCGRPVTFQDHREAVLRGFQAMYRLLIRHREALLAADGPLGRCADLEIRFLVRNTTVYAHLIHLSYHPDFLQSGLDRSRLFDRLWLDAPHYPILRLLIHDEIAELARGDTPRFGAVAGSTHLRTGMGRVLEDCFSESGLVRVRRRIAALDEEDLERQRTFVEVSLNATRPAHERLSWTVRPLREEPEPAGPARFLAAARSLGERLSNLAIRAGEHVSWLHLHATQDSWDLQPVGADLYEGLAGIALFFAHLAACTGDAGAEELARSALATMRWRVDRSPQALENIGAFSGWAGVVWTLTHLGLLWRDPSLLDEAERLAAERLAPLVGEDQHLDLIGGVAGAIIVLLALHRYRPAPEILDMAVRCGDHLLAHARKDERGTSWPPPPGGGSIPLNGLGHGAAGIGWALATLARQTGRERFLAAARGALAYERSWYIPERRNWPDLRLDRQENGEAPFFHAWCHGAPGIGLGRIATRRVLDDAEIEGEVRAALASTRKEGFGGSHCLCHGDLGNLDLLLTAAGDLRDPALGEAAGRLAAGILAEAETGGFRCGGNADQEIPGLLTGLAGIGYGLLRAANPERVPSVLILDLPSG
ncbi:MAG TPA: type 2 lanthipeptide synthetase LanM family protein [Thermoanaerobaculia bacterium]|jgi:type 2 lantibiotic biosynthesis protein LanM|nr:type 2 lanthipeptide synthetase LanM family protein [Thermoanaerobaculia bacterium]